MPQFLTPNSGTLGEFGLSECDSYGRMGKRKKRKVEEKKGGGEIHSAKAHRCVDQVMAKGHDESSAWAICNTSVGKDEMYAKGHGGSAKPKRKRRGE